MVVQSAAMMEQARRSLIWNALRRQAGGWRARRHCWSSRTAIYTLIETALDPRGIAYDLPLAAPDSNWNREEESQIRKMRDGPFPALSPATRRRCDALKTDDG
jgi:hypothetical protein